MDEIERLKKILRDGYIEKEYCDTVQEPTGRMLTSTDRDGNWLYEETVTRIVEEGTIRHDLTEADKRDIMTEITRLENVPHWRDF